MKSITIKSSAIKRTFQQLHQNIGGTLKVISNEHILEVDNDFGKGRIQGITFKGGISYLEFDMVFHDDFWLSINTTKSAPICFAYCSRGKITHNFSSEKEMHILENFQTCILTNAPEESNILYFTKDVQIKTSLIVVRTNTNTNLLKEDSLNHRLQELFLSGETAENSIYVGSYNLKIADTIQQLDAIKQQGLVRSLLIEGLVHMILAFEIQQHSDDINKAESETGTLSNSEMDLICEVSKFINNYPELSLSITELTRKTGLSPSKLQEGFKLMHGTTVSDYIRDIRLLKAEELIKNTDLNISEVVYSIGFTSRSYFSKIFRRKYNCSPKQYKDKQKSLSVSA
jgi:AraC-like DNA-binding protein